jgi:fatty acid desaturase
MKPSLAELGTDLLATSRRQRWIALARPYLGVVAFVVAAWMGWWWLTPVIMFGIFVAVVTVTHDVVHRAIGLSSRRSEWALFALGLVLLESGHAYRATHLQHHRLFALGALAYGPVFLARLWWWAWRRSPADRGWLAVEGAAPFAAIAAGIALWPATPAVLGYVLMAIVGSWVYPLLTVHLPHRHFGDDPLDQTRTLRGRVIPAIFLELTYHLEHHLYPQVPSHHLARLSRRLEEFLTRSGVVPRRVI